VDATKQRAAALTALGWGSRRVAEEVGVGQKTITRWKQLPEFQQAVAQSRPQRDENPTIRAVLEEALTTATKRDGNPDWQVRVSAARALMQLGDLPIPEAESQPQRTLVIYQRRDEEAA
jgi:hypothetical protein